MDLRPYATVDGIRPYLDSLGGLHRLVREREEAARRFELLPVFCLQGRYVLQADGRLGELIDVARRTGTAHAVMPLEEFERFGRQRFRDDWQMVSRTPARLAPEDALCPACERGWTIEDCHDAVAVRETREELFAIMLDGRTLGRIARLKSTYHEECHRKRIRNDALWWAEDFLERAGLPDAWIETVSGRINDDPTPWFRLATSAGPIRFGPRPVGYGLEWKETGRPLPNLFRGEHRFGHLIEHGAYYVLPPDESFLYRHFHRLREALGF